MTFITIFSHIFIFFDWLEVLNSVCLDCKTQFFGTFRFFRSRNLSLEPSNCLLLSLLNFTEFNDYWYNVFINLQYLFQFADCPLKVHRDLSKSELMRELKELRLKVIQTKSHSQKTSHLNNSIRSNHPLNEFLGSLHKEELNSLY